MLSDSLSLKCDIATAGLSYGAGKAWDAMFGDVDTIGDSASINGDNAWGGDDPVDAEYITAQKNNSNSQWTAAEAEHRASIKKISGKYVLRPNSDQMRNTLGSVDGRVLNNDVDIMLKHSYQLQGNGASALKMHLNNLKMDVRVFANPLNSNLPELRDRIFTNLRKVYLNASGQKIW